MAEAKAETNAKMNLIIQTSGMDFLYTKSNGSVVLSTSAKGVLTDVQKVNSYNIGDNKYLSVLSSKIEFSKIETNDASLIETRFRTENLEKSLMEKQKDAIKTIIEEKHSNVTSVKGKLYLTDISISDFEDKNDFAVAIKVLIVFSKTN